MKHTLKLEGYCFRLRPIRIEDAQFVIDVRLEDAERNRFIHTISAEVSEQEAWLNRYFLQDGDYYFVIENRVTGEREGLIAFYNEQDGSAEWGRWVLKKGSLAAAESVWLLYRIAFEQKGLKELYCRTIADSTAVVSFHDSIGEMIRIIHSGIFELNGLKYDAVEHYSDAEHFYKAVAPTLERQAKIVLRRQMKRICGNFDFHHIGVATKSIEKEMPTYLLLGYEKEDAVFQDETQGIRGQFLISKNCPRLELLENLPDSHTLDRQLESNQRLYHIAYCVKDIEKAMEAFANSRAKLLSPLKLSAYFGKRICFLMLPGMIMLELIEV